MTNYPDYWPKYYPYHSWYDALMRGRYDRRDPDKPSPFEQALEGATLRQLHNAKYQLERKPDNYGYAYKRFERITARIAAIYAEVRQARERRMTEADSC